MMTWLFSVFRHSTPQITTSPVEQQALGMMCASLHEPRSLLTCPSLWRRENLTHLLIWIFSGGVLVFIAVSNSISIDSS